MIHRTASIARAVIGLITLAAIALATQAGHRWS